jgi:Tfp pilus assembly protein PilV
MERELSPGAMAAIVVVVVVLLGLIAWRVFGTQGFASRQQQNAQTGMQQDYMMMRRMPPGAPPGGR